MAASSGDDNGGSSPVVRGSNKARSTYQARVHNTMTFPGLFAGAAGTDKAGSWERFQTLLADSDRLDQFYLIVKCLPVLEYTPAVLGLRVTVDGRDAALGYLLASNNVSAAALLNHALGRVTVPLDAKVKKFLDATFTPARAKQVLARLIAPAQDSVAEINEQLAALVANDFVVAPEDAAQLAFIDEASFVGGGGGGSGSAVAAAAAAPASAKRGGSKKPAAAAPAALGNGHADAAAAAAAAPGEAAVVKPSKKAAAAAAAVAKKRTQAEAAQSDEDGGEAAAAAAGDAKTPRHPVLTPQLIKTLMPYRDGQRKCAVHDCDKHQVEGAGKTNKGVLGTDMTLFNASGVGRMVCKRHNKESLPDYGTACMICNRSLVEPVDDAGATLPALNGAHPQQGQAVYYFHTDISLKSTEKPRVRAPHALVVCFGCLANHPGMTEQFAINGYRFTIDTSDADQVSMDITNMSNDDYAAYMSKKPSVAPAAAAATPVKAAAAAVVAMDEDTTPIPTPTPPRATTSAPAPVVAALEATLTPKKAPAKPAAPKPSSKAAAAAAASPATPVAKPAASPAKPKLAKAAAAPAPAVSVELLMDAFGGAATTAVASEVDDADDSAAVPTAAQTAAMMAVSSPAATTAEDDADLDALLYG